MFPSSPGQDTKANDSSDKTMSAVNGDLEEALKYLEFSADEVDIIESMLESQQINIAQGSEQSGKNKPQNDFTFGTVPSDLESFLSKDFLKSVIVKDCDSRLSMPNNDTTESTSIVNLKKELRNKYLGNMVMETNSTDNKIRKAEETLMENSLKIRPGKAMIRKVAPCHRKENQTCTTVPAPGQSLNPLKYQNDVGTLNPFDHCFKIQRRPSGLQAWQVSAILVRVEKEWQKSVSWNLRNHIILKIIELLIRIASTQSMLDDKVVDYVPFSKQTEFHVYQIANSKQGYYELLSDEIMEFQNLVVRLRQIKNLLDKKRLMTNRPDMEIQRDRMWSGKLWEHVQRRLQIRQEQMILQRQHQEQRERLEKRFETENRLGTHILHLQRLQAAKQRRQQPRKQLSRKQRRKASRHTCKYHNRAHPSQPMEEDLLCSSCGSDNDDIMFQCFVCDSFNLCCKCKEENDKHPHYMVELNWVDGKWLLMSEGDSD